MPYQQLDISAPCQTGILQGDDIYLCSTDDAKVKLVDGIGLIRANVLLKFEQVVLSQSPYTGCNTAVPDCVVPCASDGSTCEKNCVYRVLVNDSQIKINDLTAIKYQLGCGDITEIIPYFCGIGKLLQLYTTVRADWTIKTSAISYVATPGDQTQVYTIPIKERFSGTVVDTFTLGFRSTKITPNYGTGQLDVLHGASGSVDHISVCQLIASCFDGDTIKLDGGTGKYYADLPANTKLTTIVSAGDCTGGIGASYALKTASVNVGGDTLTLNSAPEHTTLHVESLKNTDLEVTINSPTGTVIAGSTISNHLTINNPSACRGMSWTAFARAQIGVTDVLAGTYAGIIMQLIVNGGAPINVLQVLKTVSGGNVRDTIGFPYPVYGFVSPGGSIVFGTRAVTVSDALGNQGRYSYPDVHFIGNTL